jgi:hippurate hydrolase
VDVFASHPLQHWMVALRREFHRHPELAFEEVITARTIMAALEKIGIPYSYGGVGSGVVGTLSCGTPGAPAVALRAEMDGLPGTETTGVPFASTIPGKMHVCGHDAHMAMVLGAAALLAASPPADGDVVFVFQPAEERGGGARVVLESGALDRVNAIFGGHVTHHYRVGEIMVAHGVITAQSDRFALRVHGRGGHAARPHEAIDAVVIAGLLISVLQTLVSRTINPIYPSVVTIGRVQAGSAPNVIAESAVLEGSIRTTVPHVRDQITTGIRRIAKAMGDLYDAEIEVELNEGYPPVVNSSAEADIARRTIGALQGATVVEMDHPSLGAEDFSYYLQRIPGCYVRFGARMQEQEYIPLHSPAFDVDERVLAVGASYFEAVAREALREIGRAR